ncbi:Laminin subunit alpha-2 [Phytophthora citrophthora]|uniref:Laminin subunit alpha-2 n=1 Tax=Phytophthora citrophthora TaxID=4793 RepID=A0AAD9GEV2_9STRA|nr:Laminin subunit alpha-2 [Phytophthora citrophthora]
MGEASSPSSRSPKRPRSPSSVPDDAKRLKLSPRDDVRDKTLRIVAQSLRDENRQLAQDKERLSEQLSKTQRSLQDVEDDMARVYRQKEKELQEEKQKFDQKLQDARHKPLEVEQTKEISFTVRQTTEMDKFLQSCELWQAKLKFLSTQLQEKKQKVESQELQSVVSGLVTSVEVKTLENEVENKQQLLHWALLLQEEAVDCLKKSSSCRQETELFEAMEKQLMDDRVVELETQLAQKRAVEKEKEMELSSLREDQEKLFHGVPNEEFEKLVLEKSNMEKEMKETIQNARDELERVQEENADLKTQNQKLREQKDKNDSEVKLQQDEEIRNLQERLQAAKAREAKMAATLKAAGKEMAKSKQRKEELKILYAKFSSTMDSVSEKAMRLEELGQELAEAQKSVLSVESQKNELEEQVIRLQQDASELSLAQQTARDLSDELTNVQKKCVESRELETKYKKLVAEMQAEIEALKFQNKTLKEKQVKQWHQSIGQSSLEDANELITQVGEKEALQMYVKQYHAAAEEKCRRLLEKVNDLESQQRGRTLHES